MPLWAGPFISLALGRRPLTIYSGSACADFLTALPVSFAVCRNAALISRELSVIRESGRRTLRCTAFSAKPPDLCGKTRDGRLTAMSFGIFLSSAAMWLRITLACLRTTFSPIKVSPNTRRMECHRLGAAAHERRLTYHW